MGLTKGSVGKGAVDSGLLIQKRSPEDRVVALAGNPNVGKSTVFNALTNMNQHTGNWPGKTVSTAQGDCRSEQQSYILVDIPGTYSLMAHSAEEEVARDFLCFGGVDAVVVVCDATCLERNLNLVLQTMEMSNRVVVCVNLLDEAKRKQIHVDLQELSRRLRVPVVGVVAKKKRTLGRLLDALDSIGQNAEPTVRRVQYPAEVEAAIDTVCGVLCERDCCGMDPHWLGLRLLDPDAALLQGIEAHLGKPFLLDEALNAAITDAWAQLERSGINADRLKDLVVSALIAEAEQLCCGVVTQKTQGYASFDRRLDRILTNRLTGYPTMLLLLAVIFWLTIKGANIPSQLLSGALFWVQDRLTELFVLLHAPDWLHGALVLGVYRVLAWVVSVMLPPMAIFFPLFTLLEDLGYLPRVAFNLDKPFQRCRACGKQALCMAMGFGCNAAGVVGCRIIDSPRERLLAILTNSFVPCNGRFPMLIAVISMFFAGPRNGLPEAVLSAIGLTALIALGVGATFAVTWLLSRTILKGVPSSFTLELPPYRRPQIASVLVRSVVDRTLFVLGRAAAVAAPAGLLIWLMANVTIGGQSLLQYCAAFLHPLAQRMGLDGVILIAFVLGFPANEIVLPIILMGYLAQGSLQEPGDLLQIRQLLVANGWTWTTAVSVLLFSLLHWPCSTTLLTIYKETNSLRWALLAAALPTGCGVLLCILFTTVVRLIV